eukprot:1152209-Pelagomonas_calceolata.AAC.11
MQVLEQQQQQMLTMAMIDMRTCHKMCRLWVAMMAVTNMDMCNKMQVLELQQQMLTMAMKLQSREFQARRYKEAVRALKARWAWKEKRQCEAAELLSILSMGKRVPRTETRWAWFESKIIIIT